MIEVGKGTIIKELFSRPGIRAFSVEVAGREEKCILYPDLTGEVQPGDTVLLNTSAVSLGLGSGGYHYIIANLNGQTKSMQAGGHIMKLRYTPMQVKVLSVEEEESLITLTCWLLTVSNLRRFWWRRFIPCWLQCASISMTLV